MHDIDIHYIWNIVSTRNEIRSRIWMHWQCGVNSVSNCDRFLVVASIFARIVRKNGGATWTLFLTLNGKIVKFSWLDEFGDRNHPNPKARVGIGAKLALRHVNSNPNAVLVSIHSASTDVLAMRSTVACWYPFMYIFAVPILYPGTMHFLVRKHRIITQFLRYGSRYPIRDNIMFDGHFTL